MDYYPRTRATCLEIPPGTYRIVGRTSYRLGLVVDQTFSFLIDDVAAIQKIPLVHKKVALVRCQLTLVGDAIENAVVRVQPDVAVYEPRKNGVRPRFFPQPVAPGSSDRDAIFPLAKEHPYYTLTNASRQ